MLDYKLSGQFEKLLEQFIDFAGENPDITSLCKIYNSFSSPEDKIKLLTSINCMAFTEATNYVNDNFEKIYPIINQLLKWAEELNITSDILAGNNYLAFVNCDNIDVRNLLWSKAGQEQKIEMLRAWDYSSFKTATNKEEINQLLSWGVELHMELELLLQGNLFDREILGNLDPS